MFLIPADFLPFLPLSPHAIYDNGTAYLEAPHQPRAVVDSWGVGDEEW